MVSKTCACADPGIFVRWGPGQSDKIALTTFFFSPQLITCIIEVKWSISKKSIIFQGSRGGPTFCRQGEVQLFPGGPIAYSL